MINREVTWIFCFNEKRLEKHSIVKLVYNYSIKLECTLMEYMGIRWHIIFLSQILNNFMNSRVKILVKGLHCSCAKKCPVTLLFSIHLSVVFFMNLYMAYK